MLYGGISLPGKPDLNNIAALDRLPLPMIARMQRYGIAIDIPYLQGLSYIFSGYMRELERDISSYVPRWALDQFVSRSGQIEEQEGDARINAASAAQISSLLFDTLKVGSGKKLKLTAGGRRPSTGKKQLELLKEDHAVIPLILKYREYAKLKSTYTDSLPLLAKFHPKGSCPVCELTHVESTHRVHTEFPTTRAATGRLASRGPNLQNIPIRTEEGALVRYAFIASPGTRIVSRDFSQIELRGAAHCANAQSMIDVYKQKKDIHIFTACRAFGLDYEKYAKMARNKKSLSPKDKEEFTRFSLQNRLPSKNLNFMIFYGASAKGLQAQLALSNVHWDEYECQKFIDNWFELYPEVRAYLDLQMYRARRYGYVWDQFGRIRLTPEIRSVHSWVSAAGIRQAGNHPIQSIAAGQMKLAMGESEELLLLMLQSGIWAWPLLTIHDQLMIEVEEEYADTADDLIGEVFKNVMIDKNNGEDLFRVPIESDGEILERWEKT